MKKNILWIIFPLCTLFSCTEKIDQSARYVFQDYTVTSYLETHEQYSTYYQLLDMVPVSAISKTTVKQLVSARGNYTVFAPTNEAIGEYLNKLHAKGIIETPSWDGFHDSITLDSVRQVIVYNSIIDGGDNTHAFETNNFPIANGAELPLSTMNDTKITVQYGDSTDWDIKVADAIVDKKNRDIPVSNGIIHAVHNVVAPDNNSLAQYLTNILGGRKEGFHVAALMVEAAGLMDTLSKVRDDVYEKLYQEGRIPDYTSQYGYTYDTNACAPEHRYYGFSFFAETDEFWSNAIGKPALEITLDDVMEYLEGQGVYPDATRDKNYTQENNLLNRFITYHIIPARLTPDRLIYHYNEMGYNHTTGNLGVAMSEFYVTLGKRRLLKIYESRESNGVYLNRFPNLDNRRHGTYHELSCDPDKEGVFVGETNREGENNIRNAIIYPINKLLVYDDDTRDNLGKYGRHLLLQRQELLPVLISHGKVPTGKSPRESPHGKVPTEKAVSFRIIIRKPRSTALRGFLRAREATIEKTHHKRLLSFKKQLPLQRRNLINIIYFIPKKYEKVFIGGICRLDGFNKC